MQPTELACDGCGVRIAAKFPEMPLSGLPIEHQRFIEMFVLASGNLKEIASHAGVSYPTVRSRLDKVIAALRDLMKEQQSAAKKAGKKVSEPSVAEIIKRI